jgi:amidohydrolase
MEVSVLHEEESDLNRQELKERVAKAIDARRDDIIAIGEQILRHPELGYKEFKTAGLVQETFDKLNLKHRDGIGVTGVIADLPGAGNDATIAVMGELDSVLCPKHPFADPITGAAHSCGHNAQIAALLGVAFGLAESGVMKELSGSVKLMAVPAEEPVEIEFRHGLMQQGKISFLGGKQEFIKLGEFDNVDAMMMCHLSTLDEDPKKKVVMGGTSNGFLAKLIKYKGKEAHAGGAPHRGVNALNAATLGLMGIHANRETFQDADMVRVHPIITHGGDLVNIVPADVRIETYVRAKTMEAVADASAKTNRALKAGAMAVGAEVEINEIPGFLPEFDDPNLADLLRANAASLLGADSLAVGDHSGGSSDVADVAHLLPTVQPYINAVKGRGHSEEYEIVDPELAYITTAKLMAFTVVDLLADGAKGAKDLKSKFQPRYTRESWLALWNNLCDR